MAINNKIDPFTQLDSLIPLISDLFAAIKQKSEKSRDIMQHVIDSVVVISDSKPDATLAAIHLSNQVSPLKQPIYCAALAHMIGKQHEIKPDIQPVSYKHLTLPTKKEVEKTNVALTTNKKAKK